MNTQFSFRFQKKPFSAPSYQSECLDVLAICEIWFLIVTNEIPIFEIASFSLIRLYKNTPSTTYYHSISTDKLTFCANSLFISTMLTSWQVHNDFFEDRIYKNNDTTQIIFSVEIQDMWESYYQIIFLNCVTNVFFTKEELPKILRLQRRTRGEDIKVTEQFIFFIRFSIA